MDNDIISEFISKVVLNFEDNYVVNNIIKKLANMYNSSDITTNGNTITSKSERIKRIITVDTDNQKIIVQDIENNDKQFYAETTYTVEGEESVHHKYSARIEIGEGNSDSVRKTGYIYDTYEYFNNNKIIGSSDTKIKIEEIQTRLGEILNREKNEFNRMIYKLANGDAIKIISNNGNSKYYYCDNQVLKNRTLSIEEQKKLEIGVELSEKQAESILDFSYDTYKTINNQTVYSIRGDRYK